MTKSIQACMLSVVFISFNVPNAQGQTSYGFSLKEHDKVVFLGDGLIEQAQYSGWIELMLTTSFPDKHVTFRNLGWSGDTPAGDSRFGLSLLQAGREPDDEGWKQLQKQLKLTMPSVVVFGYGMASSLESGDAGLAMFIKDFEQLLATLKSISPEVRFLFLSPIQRSDSKHPHAQTIYRYAEAIRSLAEKHSSSFVSLLSSARKDGQRKDAIHLNKVGYRAVAEDIQNSLDLPNAAWTSSSETEKLRQVILRKNEWWFHRSRPANMAYVFGFRKHEQGQNAVEIPQFDQLIETEESTIARLRSLQPVAMEKLKPRLESKYAKFVEQPVPDFTVGEELEVTLWAQNPQLNKPIHMNFDPQGRLWVASSEAYPMIEVGQSAPDKIVVLEDTNGDGKSDRSTVFADGLLIPTGIEPGDGGVYVAQSTDLLFLKDTDGDGKADVKRRVLSGFGTEDTHHNLHTLRWGPDGRLYMNQSIYTRTDTETPHGVVRLKAGGGFRYHSKSMRMEVFFRGLVNSWGHQFDEYGQSFLTDGAGFQGVAYTFPGAMFAPTPGARRQLALISPGSYPKFASKEIVSGNSFPESWQGSIVTCDFRANRVARFSLQDQGSGFSTKQEADLLRTAVSTFRPIDIKQGPDGALYIADWSNPIINHGEVDFRDERRDRWHGRIWRVSWKGAAPRKKTDLTTLSTAQLLDSLNSNDRFTRDQARRVLIGRPRESATLLSQWLEEQSTDKQRLHGLWLSQSLDIRNDELLRTLLVSKDGRIRAAAVRVLADWSDPQCDLDLPIDKAMALALYSDRIHDEHPRVRLEAVRGVAKFKNAEAISIALSVMERAMDPFLDYGLWLAVNECAEPFVAALEQGSWRADTAKRITQLEFALVALEPVRAQRYLAKYLADHPIPKDGAGPWIELVGKAGGPAELTSLFTQAGAGGFSTQATARALDSLLTARRLRNVKPTGSLEKLMPMIESPEASIQLAAIRLTGAWKMKNMTGRLAELITAETTGLATRHGCIDAVRKIGGAGAVKVLRDIVGSPLDLADRKKAVVALAGLNIQSAVKPFYQILDEVKSEQEALVLWRQILGRKETGKVLAGAVPATGLALSAARAGLAAARGTGRNEPELIAALTPHSGVPLTPEAMTPERIREMMKIVTRAGDATRGELVYRKKDLACVLCHAIGGVGGKVGPDMTSLGASAPLDYIIEALYKPDAKIKEGFHSVIVATDDGKLTTGIEVSNAGQELVIRDANNKIVRIPKNTIDVKENGKSLMPADLLNRIPQQERIDLIAFLSQLGKPGEFDASQGGVARTFEVLAGTHRVEQRGLKQITEGTLKQGWKPVNTLVNGTVSGALLKSVTKPPRNVSLVNVYLRVAVRVQQNTAVTFAVEGPKNPSVWIDGSRVEASAAGVFKSTLANGSHTFLMRLDARQLPNFVRVKSRDVSFASE